MFKAEFQSFEEKASPGAGAGRVAALRAELTRRKLDGFVVTTADQHQNEYVPPSEERLAWLTGFTGSLGAAVILKDKAALFVDGRYTLQAKEQTDGKVFAIEHLVERPPHEWLAENLPTGARSATTRGARRSTARSGCKRQPSVRARNWWPSTTTRSMRSGPTAPPRRLHPVKLHDLKFAGEPAEKNSRASATSLQKRSSTPSSFPIPPPSPGPSIFAAAT
jgi:Xaa-Pro aminopeptidase